MICNEGEAGMNKIYQFRSTIHFLESPSVTAPVVPRPFRC